MNTSTAGKLPNMLICTQIIKIYMNSSSESLLQLPVDISRYKATLPVAVQ
jgi:hypothetical protein